MRARWFVSAAALARGRRVLEIGCGIGLITQELAKVTDADIVATDLSPALTAQAAASAPAGVQVLVGDAEHLDYPDGAFDAVVGNSVLHHLRLPHALPEMLRVLRPGGRFAFVEPNQLNPQVALMLSTPERRARGGASEDEQAFVRWRLRSYLSTLPMHGIRVEPFDFLHPSTPPLLIDAVERLSRILERIPLVREISGSLAISATRT